MLNRGRSKNPASIILQKYRKSIQFAIGQHPDPSLNRANPFHFRLTTATKKPDPSLNQGPNPFHSDLQLPAKTRSISERGPTFHLRLPTNDFRLKAPTHL
jgi:hypothetical protein